MATTELSGTYVLTQIVQGRATFQRQISTGQNDLGLEEYVLRYSQWIDMGRPSSLALSVVQ